LYAFRLLAMREVGRWTGFLATSAWALLWLPASASAPTSQVWTFAAGFSVPLVFLTLLAQSLGRHFGAAYTGLYGGLARQMPRFAGVMVVSVLAATATPLFPSFFAMLRTLIVSEPGPAVALAAIWLIWSWAAARLIQGLIVGTAEPSPDLDLGIRTAWAYATGLAGLVLVGLILIGGRL
jgi:NADH:ubiquinone oxidoreductase subunit 4 (subunit M)